LDEAEALPWMLGRIPAGFRPIVVDNGSVDDSARIAPSLGVSRQRPGSLTTRDLHPAAIRATPN
jgi:hypothetical protein